MAEILSGSALFALVLTLGAFQIALWLQKKLKSPVCNPILVSTVLVIGVLLLTGIPAEEYQADMQILQWLLTPATVCLALPLYEQLKILKKDLSAILVGVAAGTVTSLVFVFFSCQLFTLDHMTTVSLLPKSITTAMGIVLSGQNGGLEALTAVVIIVTGIFGNLTGSLLCRLCKITHPIAQGTAFGTASHVVGTSRAAEIDPLTGAVSSLSLTVAGILTAVLFPLVCGLL